MVVRDTGDEDSISTSQIGSHRAARGKAGAQRQVSEMPDEG